MAKYFRQFIYPVLSAILLALAYPSFGLPFGFLVFFGLIPFFCDKNNRGFNDGFVLGLTYFALTFRWFWFFYPLDTLNINSKLLSFIIVLLIYLLSVAAMAAFWGLSSKIIFNFKFSIFKGPAIAAVFTLTEYLRSFGFGLLWSGAGGLFGPNWTMGNFAYSLSTSFIWRYLSSFVGIYGLVFLIVLINVLFASFIIQKKYSRALILAIIVLTVYFIPLPKNNLSDTKAINFAIIQTSQPTKMTYTPAEKLKYFKTQLELLNQTARQYPETQLILFPETSDFFKDVSTFLNNDQVRNYFTNLFKNPVLIVSGARVTDQTEKIYSRVFALNTKQDIVGYYDKMLLSPFGEYLPYSIKAILNFVSKTKLAEYDTLREFSIGHSPVSGSNTVFNLNNEFTVAPVVCSELWSPGLVKQNTSNADIILLMTSSGIFHANPAIDREILAVAKMLSAQNRKPLIMASNMGISFALDARGEIIAISPQKGSMILTGKVVTNIRESWYNVSQ